MKEIKQIVKFYKKHLHNETAMALATVVNVEDSSYRRIGARMLILENGQWIGGISGGCLEGDVLKHAKKVMTDNSVKLISYDTREGDPYQIGVGLGCEGKIDIFLQALPQDSPVIKNLETICNSRKSKVLITPFQAANTKNHLLGKSVFSSEVENMEFFRKGLNKAIFKKSSIVETIVHNDEEIKVLFERLEPNIRFVIAGHNYDIYPMISIAKEMGWEIDLICNKHKISKRVAPDIKTFFGFDELEKVPMDSFTAIVSMAHDYNKDLKVLSAFHCRNVGYFGMLGPKKRFKRMCHELLAGETRVKQIYNPVGLDIGSSSPEEIALATIAEIVKHFKGATGISLKDKAGFIHKRKEL